MFGVPIVAVLVLLGICAVPLILLLDALGHRAQPIGSGALDEDAVARTVRSNRWRLAGCLVGTGAALVIGVWLNDLWPALLGIPLAVAPGLAASVALLAYATWPATERRDPRSGPASASLRRRQPWGFAPRRTFGLPLVLALTYLLVLLAGALVAEPDDAGRLRAFGLTQGDLSSRSSPFPGSFYGLPLAGVTVVLVAATYAALRRMAASPAVVHGSLTPATREVDRRWRAISTSVIVRTATASLLGYAAATLVIGGSAILRVSGPDNGMTATPWIGVGWTAAVVGVVALLAAAVVAGSAVAALLSLRTRAVLGPVVVPPPRR